MSSTVVPTDSLISVTDVVDGTPMHARVSVRTFAREATPVVFVHGLGMSSRYLEPTMVRLASTYPVAGPDLPGFGRSGSPRRALDLCELAMALATWMDVRGIGPAVLVGNSYGCQVIVELVTREPQRALGLVLNAPTMDPSHRSVLGQVSRVIADIPFESLPLATHVVRDYLRAGPLRLLATLRHALADRIEEKLPAIVAPTLVVCGGRDPLVTEDWCVEATRLIGMSVPGAAGATLVVLPKASHAVPFDDPESFARLIDEFVGRVALAASSAQAVQRAQRS